MSKKLLLVSTFVISKINNLYRSKMAFECQLKGVSPKYNNQADQSSLTWEIKLLEIISLESINYLIKKKITLELDV